MPSAGIGCRQGSKNEEQSSFYQLAPDVGLGIFCGWDGAQLQDKHEQVLRKRYQRITVFLPMAEWGSLARLMQHR